MREFKVKEDARLKRCLEDCFPELTDALFKQLFSKRDIKVNGARVGADARVKSGDVIAVYIAEDRLKKIAPDIVYEDKNILIADKPPGITSKALFNLLSREKTVYFVHRLDRNTAGLILFAKTRAAETGLLKAFKNRLIKKTYLALIYGVPKERERLLTAYLKKDEKNALVHISAEKKEGYVQIKTHYKILQTYKETSLAEIDLITGKTHQIRAHMAFAGHFIIGDGKYGKNAENKRLKKSVQCLNAHKIELGGLSAPLDYLNGKQFKSEKIFDFKQ